MVSVPRAETPADNHRPRSLHRRDQSLVVFGGSRPSGAPPRKEGKLFRADLNRHLGGFFEGVARNETNLAVAL